MCVQVYLSTSCVVFMYIFVCVYVHHTYMYMCVYVYVCVFVCVYVCVCVHVCMCVFVCEFVKMVISLDLNVNMKRCMRCVLVFHEV